MSVESGGELAVWSTWSPPRAEPAWDVRLRSGDTWARRKWEGRRWWTGRAKTCPPGARFRQSLLSPAPRHLSLHPSSEANRRSKSQCASFKKWERVLDHQLTWRPPYPDDRDSQALPLLTTVAFVTDRSCAVTSAVSGDWFSALV